VHGDSERDDTGDTEMLSVTDCDDDGDSVLDDASVTDADFGGELDTELDNDRVADAAADIVVDPELTRDAEPTIDTVHDTDPLTTSDADSLIDADGIVVDDDETHVYGPSVTLGVSVSDVVADTLRDGDDDTDIDRDGEVVALAHVDADADPVDETLAHTDRVMDERLDALNADDTLTASEGATVMLVRCVPLMES